MNLSASEVIIVLVIALLVFGPKRLPEMARQLGKGIREFKGHMSAIGDQVSDLDTAQPAARTAPAAAAPAASPDGAPTVALAPDDDDLLDGVVVSGGTPPGHESQA